MQDTVNNTQNWDYIILVWVTAKTDGSTNYASLLSKNWFMIDYIS